MWFVLVIGEVFECGCIEGVVDSFYVFFVVGDGKVFFVLCFGMFVIFEVGVVFEQVFIWDFDGCIDVMLVFGFGMIYV